MGRPMSGGGRPPRAVSPWPFVGMAGMACVLFLYGASVLLAPWWAVVGLLVLWVVLFVRACRWWSARPDWVPLLPVLATVVWFAVMIAGGVLLGWRWDA